MNQSYNMYSAVRTMATAARVVAALEQEVAFVKEWRKRAWLWQQV